MICRPQRLCPTHAQHQEPGKAASSQVSRGGCLGETHSYQSLYISPLHEWSRVSLRVCLWPCWVSVQAAGITQLPALSPSSSWSDRLGRLLTSRPALSIESLRSFARLLLMNFQGQIIGGNKTLGNSCENLPNFLIAQENKTDISVNLLKSTLYQARCFKRPGHKMSLPLVKPTCWNLMS